MMLNLSLSLSLSLSVCLSAGSLKATLIENNGSMFAAKFNHDGSRIATGGVDQVSAFSLFSCLAVILPSSFSLAYYRLPSCGILILVS